MLRPPRTAELATAQTVQIARMHSAVSPPMRPSARSQAASWARTQVEREAPARARPVTLPLARQALELLSATVVIALSIVVLASYVRAQWNGDPQPSCPSRALEISG
jgi:hypothetical protein